MSETHRRKQERSTEEFDAAAGGIGNFLCMFDAGSSMMDSMATPIKMAGPSSDSMSALVDVGVAELMSPTSVEVHQATTEAINAALDRLDKATKLSEKAMEFVLKNMAGPRPPLLHDAVVRIVKIQERSLVLKGETKFMLKFKKTLKDSTPVTQEMAELAESEVKAVTEDILQNVNILKVFSVGVK